MASFAVILPAAGKSSRFHHKHYKKPFAPLDNRAVWLHSAEKFLNRDDVKQLILVIAAEDLEAFHSKFAENVAVNRGALLGVFSEEEEAIRWLLSMDNDPDENDV